MNQYETVFILTPVLSDVQMKEAVEKFKGILTAEGAEIINEENWGLKKFLNEQGKILPRRITGTSLKFQRRIAQAVKRARHLALLPFVTDMMK